MDPLPRQYQIVLQKLLKILVVVVVVVKKTTSVVELKIGNVRQKCQKSVTLLQENVGQSHIPKLYNKNVMKCKLNVQRFGVLNLYK